MARHQRGAFPVSAGAVSPAKTSLFRPDIQALRAIAVAAVVLYHAGVPWLAGGYVGVDIFFVISGFLIIGLLWREIEETGRIGLRAFYARRIRRLLPMSALVGLAVLIASRLVLPPLALPGIAKDAIGSSMMIVNLLFARAGTQYSGNPAPSPFQHYWSLNLEEQFYAVLPLVLIGCWFVISTRRRAGVIAVLLAISAASLIACVAMTSSSFAWAFYSLPTRAWELCLGGVLALSAPGVARSPQWLRSWGLGIGLVVLAAAVVLFSEKTVFPGFMALIPVVGTLLVIAGGVGNRGRLVIALGWRPIRFVGDISYSLYLWHWPLLVIPMVALGAEINGWTRAGLVLIAVGLAAISYRLVELRFQRMPLLTRRLWSPYLLAGVLVVVTLASSLVVAQLPRLDSGQEATPFAMTLSGTVPALATFVPANVVPTLEHGRTDIPVADTETCVGGQILAGPGDCVFGDVASARQIVLFGDSHAAQWFSPIATLATENSFSLVSLTKGGCPAASVTFLPSDKRATDGCSDWRRSAIRRITALAPALVIVADYAAGYSKRLATADTDAVAWQTALSKTLAQLPTDSRVMVLGDTPAWNVDPNVCLSGHLVDAQSCARPVATLSNPDLIAAEQAAAAANRAAYVPTLGWLCGAQCSPLAWNVLVYRDGHHLTNEMAKTLQKPLEAAIQAQLG
jgi:peptidoglycan/LPS O-acetylase OafA/YrhL